MGTKLDCVSALACRVVLLLVVAGASALAACGGSDPEQTRRDPPPDTRLALIGQREIGKLRGNSVERAFFEYWSNLQFQAWPAATSYLAPGLKRAAGGERNVIATLSSESSFFRTARLRLVSSNERRGLTTLRYMVSDDATGRVPRSTTWRRTRGGGWRSSMTACLLTYSPATR